MFGNYFKIAWQNLRKNKTFSAINIFGLSVGIAAFLLITSYLRFEYSYDDDQPNKDRIFRVPTVISGKGDKEQAFAYTYPAVAPALKDEFPEIEEVARLTEWRNIVTYGDEMIAESKYAYFADPALFRIFSFQFIKGNASTALKELNNAVITAETAKKYFGSDDPIGKTLHYMNQDYNVSAVIELPPNSHLRFNVLLNLEKLTQRIPLNTLWGETHFYTYALMKPGTNATALQAKLPAFAERHLGERMKKNGTQVSFALQRLKDIHLRSTYDLEMEGNGNFPYLKYLGIAALLILLIAWINYINLSTAISLDRFREVGARKVIGATKFQLVRQFLTESLFLNAAAILIGILIFNLTLPSFSVLVQKQVSALNISDWPFWIFGVTLLLLGTLLAAFYPAFVLSSFKPIYAIKNSPGPSGLTGGKTILRKSLVVVQFTIAIVLIAGAIGFYRQLRFMQTRDLGINIQQTLVLQKTPTNDSTYIAVNTAFINELKSNPSIVSVTASDAVPGSAGSGDTRFALKNSKDEKLCGCWEINKEFISSYGLTIIDGRNLLPSERRGVDAIYVQSVLVNESAVRLFGFSNPSEILGQEMTEVGFIPCKVVGVVKDFHQRSLQYDFTPMVFIPSAEDAWTNLSLKLNTTNLSSVIEFVKSKWSAFYPDMPFRYFFLDDYFNQQYKSDRIFATVLWFFTIIAIIVACLGLFALSLFTITKRSKEISIRKILGSTEIQITGLITKDYMSLVVTAGVIALPLAYLLVSNWLKNYVFRIHIGLWFFFIPVLLIILIALITVIYQSMKAANANPVKNLRTE